MEDTRVKRVFIGLEILAPWPEHLPAGRLIEESERHMTLAFLGNTPIERLKEALQDFPTPDFTVGLVGTFDQCLFLPPHKPSVVAWHADCLKQTKLNTFQKTLTEWLQQKGFSFDQKKEFLPHVALARSPFDIKPWKASFSILPFIAKDIHLYESLGHSKYTSLWTYTFKSPFEEIAHTADIAFLIRGNCLEELFLHAQSALCFCYPPLTAFAISPLQLESLIDIIIALNERISTADQEIGVPLKAISFHGDIQEETDGTLYWEMIVDV